MTWTKGQKGYFRGEPVVVTRGTTGEGSRGDGTVDVQLIDENGDPKPAATPGAAAWFDNVPEGELSPTPPTATASEKS